MTSLNNKDVHKSIGENMINNQLLKDHKRPTHMDLFYFWSSITISKYWNRTEITINILLFNNRQALVNNLLKI